MAETIKQQVEREIREREEAEYQEWKKEFELTHFKVIHPTCAYGKVYDGKVELTTEKDLFDSYKHKWKTFLKRWVEDSEMRCYDSVVFAPPPLKIENPNVYNLWQGFPWDSYTPKTAKEDGDKAIDLFNDLVKVVVNNSNRGEYFKKLIAHMVQYPGKKTGICFVLTGEQGTGKGTTASVVKRIVGLSNTYKTASALTGVFTKFNFHLADKIFVELNEADSITQYKYKDLFKDMITDETGSFEAKFGKTLTLTSCLRFWIFTNNENPVNVENSCRRFYVERTSNQRKRDYDFFEKLNNLSDDDIYWLYQHFKNYDIKGFNFEKELPETETKQSIRTHLIKTHESWLIEFLDKNLPLNEMTCTHEELRADWKAYLESNMIRKAKNGNQLLGWLTKVKGVTSTKSGTRKKTFDVPMVVEWLKENNIPNDLPTNTECLFAA